LPLYGEDPFSSRLQLLRLNSDLLTRKYYSVNRRGLYRYLMHIHINIICRGYLREKLGCGCASVCVEGEVREFAKRGGICMCIY